MRTFVIGDIHGAYEALLQCLQRASFDYNEDTLIVLGDICDGWPQTKEVVAELLKIKNRIQILGNHDEWLLDFFKTGATPIIWTSQGGQATLASYAGGGGVPDEHVRLLEAAKCAHLDDKNRLFVHGGVDPNQIDVSKQHPNTCMWDRDLLYNAMRSRSRGDKKKYGPWYEIYVGHTSIYFKGYSVPTKFCNVWAMDTGAGWEGKLSIMDLCTKEYYQSDIVSSLYPDSVHALFSRPY